MEPLQFNDQNGNNFPDWVNKSFFDVFFFSDLNKKKSIKKSDYLDKGKYPIIDQGSKDIGGYYNNSDYLIDRSVIIYGDHTTKLKFIDYPFIKGAEGIKILEVKNDVDLLFAYYLLLEKNIPQAGYKRHLNLLTKLKFKIPVELEEQQRIATFLNNIDAYYQSYLDELDILNFYKNTLSTMLFKKRIRFTSSSNDLFSDWVENKLGDLIIKIRSGGTPLTRKIVAEESKIIPFTKIKDITRQGKFLRQTTAKISYEQLNNSSAWIIPENSILYTIYASTGFSSINTVPVTTSQAILGIIPDSTKIDLHFFYYNLQYYKPKLKAFVDIGTQTNLTLETVKNFLIDTPNLMEQQKIGDFLNTTDSYLNEKLLYLETIKKYKYRLMQELFL